ncbi:hypothetical protein EMEDMD4_1080020 [Sinorhizobium medicae]|uniref:Uncharacterized protein n=1 Tax=Sinorhizobium medicae TaxID=110321 RepID=A0A508WQ53_9HYPH|nr:hypothetical protein EMEDMD4_1080020 [Sinorhizobium medicae]
MQFLIGIDQPAQRGRLLTTADRASDRELGLSRAAPQSVEKGPDRQNLRQATFGGGFDWSCTSKKRAGVRAGEPGSGESPGEVELKRLVETYHGARPQQLILGLFAGEAPLPYAHSGALRHVGGTGRISKAERPGASYPSIGPKATALCSAGSCGLPAIFRTACCRCIVHLAFV